ncbi:DUF3987 domain-containing protein [Vreelandella venusta]|uniref:DUF3987 domain-containing protein n=1 Tax=Vreelandella venusta TaxID=44935 RepID=UPI0011715207|nr:DUF3987 domain-containing protein [Halomonas venusta]GEK52339.1 hypothetical protein HVE01_30600 [Halomonas venusta]
MKAYEDMPFHPDSEKLVNVIRNVTGQDNIQFYRVVVAYYMSLMASSMGAVIRMSPKETLPINFFGIGLAPSGTGKDFSVKIIEEDVLDQFVDRFLTETLPIAAEDHLPKLANKRAIRKGVDPDEELARVTKEYECLGSPVFSFDSATLAAVRQFRHKLLMSNLGALNLQINEIGTNLVGKQDELNVFIELYDGKLKSALTKNTQDNSRSEEIRGRVPANMLLFGTPSSLLQTGSKLEEQFQAMMETGYARRCFFAHYEGKVERVKMTPEEELQRRYNTDNMDYLQELSDRFAARADLINAHKEIIAPKEVLLANIRYKQYCEDRADKFKEHQVTLQQEMKNRHFKALKLAGAYAFVDDSPEITLAHLEQAIALAEASGKCFKSINTQKKHYEKLAEHIADMGEDITHADLDVALPFYPKAANQRNDMLNMAIAWGYKNNIIIKKAFQDGIEFLRGETLKKTDLTQIPLSYSKDIATGYINELAPFEQLHKLTQASNLHWVSHFLRGGHRQEDNIEPGFSVVVLDVDGGVQLSTAQLLLKDYKYLMYTTKRHTDQEHRFRIVLPMNYRLELDTKDYKEFMKNIYEWMPFEVDTATGQRARKWMSHNGHYVYNDGELLDVLPFIPKTSKNEEHRKRINNQQSLDNLERWVINNTGDGNRNNQLLRYAMILVDAGFGFDVIRTRVIDLNDKLADKLDETEIMSTIMVSAGKALAKQP